MQKNIKEMIYINEFDRLAWQAERMKSQYPEGIRVELIEMGEDPQRVPSGTRGTVNCVDDIGTVFVRWDNGSGLGLVMGEDSFRKLTEEEIQSEQEELNTEEDSQGLSINM